MLDVVGRNTSGVKLVDRSCVINIESSVFLDTYLI